MQKHVCMLLCQQVHKVLFIFLKHMRWQLSLKGRTDNRLLSMLNCKAPVPLQLAVYALLGTNLEVLTPLLSSQTHEELIFCRLVDTALQ